MKIAIMGAGFVGESLGRGLQKVGHEVMFSSRNPQSARMQALHEELGTPIGTVAETFAFSDIIAIAMGWEAIPDMAQQAGDWSDKIVLDMTQGTIAEMAQHTQGARIIKIFNTIGAEHYQQPKFAGHAATMFYCGDDVDAKNIASELATDLGFEAIDAGDASVDTHLVNLARFWIHLAFRAGQGRDIAFRLMKK